MKKAIISILTVCCLLAISLTSANTVASEKTTNTTSGIVSNTEPFQGYILYTHMNSGFTTYLINETKQIVHTWFSPFLGMDAHLLKNGNLLRTRYLFNPFFSALGGCTGGVEIRDWKGTLLWSFRLSSFQTCLHHDIEPLPNGNILMIAWEKKTRNDAINAGCNPDLISGLSKSTDYIIEVDPTKPSGQNIVWEWHAWDHLIQDYDSTKANYNIVGEHPELIDINFGHHNQSKELFHVNSLDYNEEFDQLLMSVRNFDEIWVIDHSTTTSEAAGHIGGNSGKGGDLLYRWGNPQSYERGNISDKKFDDQHDARWIQPECPGAGHMTVFSTFTVEEIIPPVDSNGSYYREPGCAYGPEDPVWSYNESDGYSGAQRLPNGNTLFCNAAKDIFSVITPEKNIVWNYQYAQFRFKMVWKMEYYPIEYPGLIYLP